jgi:leukotriene-A4 hydrolase
MVYSIIIAPVYLAKFNMRIIRTRTISLTLISLLFQHSSCKHNTTMSNEVNNDTRSNSYTLSKDVHSYSRPNEVRIDKMEIDLSVDFEAKTLSGFVRLHLNRMNQNSDLHLDVRQLSIEKVHLDNGQSAKYSLGADAEYFGQDMSITLSDETKYVDIYYTTHPDAEALQWLSPEQTAGKTHPFLFSQSQAILARTWLPCQDSPGVKFTYSAIIRTSPNLMALMSAKNGTAKTADGVYQFEMDQPVSSYLMALTVGDLDFESVGRNSGVYAEPVMLDKCVWEFADMQSMIDSAESLYGPYAWGQYDIVVLPPSFPFGGMENPRLTFATPTIIAGDRSLVSLVAHELAHSWSGNLVTNETWNDFWLNEGFTVYFEQRIMEKIFGTPFEEMQTKLGMDELKETIEDLTKKGQKEDTHLYLNLDGRNPDDGLTDVAYEKGRFFLQVVEKAVGRSRFDVFLKKYFTDNAFKPMNTERFLAYLDDNLLMGDSALHETIRINDWVYGPGLPSNAPVPASAELDKVSWEYSNFESGSSVAELNTTGWTTHQWLYFLRSLEKSVTLKQMNELDDAHHFSQSGNSEILCDWFQLAIKTNYQKAYPAMEIFLTTVGRRKFLTPLYKPLAATEEGKVWAKRVFEIARPVYHSVAENTIEEILK